LKAISNSSVLIALSSIGQLSLLKQRFSDGVLIPQAVWHEVVETGLERVGARQVASVSWIKRKNVTNKSLVSLIRKDLDEGEAEAITLFCEQSSDALLLDEKAARQVARRMNIPVLGTVGILIWAKQNSIIPNLKEQLDILQTQGRFRLSQRLYDEALRKVGEL
jgi:uncharacterized protein